MAEELLTPQDAAQRWGIAVPTVYDWLGKSAVGQLVLGGERVIIQHYQTGAKGQGRIRIPASEIDRILDLMRVHSKVSPPRRSIARRDHLPGITVALGRPAAP